MQIKTPPGTYDILPEDIGQWVETEKIIEDLARRFGFQEIRTPIFEHTELFTRGVGETTDIVSKEMYTFTDKGDRSLTLRPEGTAACVRALVEHKVYNSILPVKWYYMGPMFRYDRPQTGRYRQFHQFGVEAFGSGSPWLDVEIIVLLMNLITAVGITSGELHINSVGCPVCRQAYREQLIAFLRPEYDRLCADCRNRYSQNPLRVLDCKVKSCQQIIANAPVMSDFLCADCRQHHEVVLDGLTLNNIKYVQDNKLVRGLDYYTRTAFEAILGNIGAQSALGGGGRYNNLVVECGGPDLPGIGFAVGLERLLLAREQEGRIAQPDTVELFIVSQDSQFMPAVMQWLGAFRAMGIATEADYNQRSMKAQMKYANKLGARVVIILGENEMQSQTLTVRNMETSEQHQVAFADSAAYVQNLLAE